MMDVRPASEADIPALISMGRAMHRESARYSRLDFSEDKVSDLLHSLIVSTLTTPAPSGVFVVYNGDRLVGAIIGFVTEVFFSRDKVAADYAFFVRPDYRHGFVAMALVRAFEKWAAEQGVVEILAGTSTMVDPEATLAFYRALDYRLYGYALTKRL